MDKICTLDVLKWEATEQSQPAFTFSVCCFTFKEAYRPLGAYVTRLLKLLRYLQDHVAKPYNVLVFTDSLKPNVFMKHPEVRLVQFKPQAAYFDGLFGTFVRFLPMFAPIDFGGGYIAKKVIVTDIDFTEAPTETFFLRQVTEKPWAGDLVVCASSTSDSIRHADRDTMPPVFGGAVASRVRLPMDMMVRFLQDRATHADFKRQLMSQTSTNWRIKPMKSMFVYGLDEYFLTLIRRAVQKDITFAHYVYPHMTTVYLTTAQLLDDSHAGLGDPEWSDLHAALEQVAGMTLPSDRVAETIKSKSRQVFEPLWNPADAASASKARLNDLKHLLQVFMRVCPPGWHARRTTMAQLLDRLGSSWIHLWRG